jgi:hypothetical protein
MAKNMNKTSYNKAFGVAGVFAAFAMAFFAIVPVTHAANYGSGNNNRGNYNYGGTYINGGNHNGNQGGYGGGNDNHGNNYNYGGTYMNGGNHDQSHGQPYQDHNDYHPTNYNYGGTYGYNYSSNSTPTVIYQPVQTYYDYQPAPTYYQQPTQIYYQQPTQTYYQPQVAINYQTEQYPQYQVVGQNTTNGLNISCSVDSSTATINQPVSWTATVTGGAAPYTYSWSGSDGMSGSQSSIIKYYGSSGYKVATVSVTSADGLTNTHTCENAVTVRNPGSRTVRQATNTTPAAQPATTNPNAAAAGLVSIPWGWIAFLIILVLVITIAYLLFTETKKV